MMKTIDGTLLTATVDTPDGPLVVEYTRTFVPFKKQGGGTSVKTTGSSSGGVEGVEVIQKAEDEVEQQERVQDTVDFQHKHTLSEEALTALQNKSTILETPMMLDSFNMGLLKVDF